MFSLFLTSYVGRENVNTYVKFQKKNPYKQVLTGHACTRAPSKNGERENGLDLGQLESRVANAILSLTFI